MNKQALQKTRDALAAARPEQYDHCIWIEGEPHDPDCETIACIAGWAVLAHGMDYEFCTVTDMPQVVGKANTIRSVDEVAAEILGLTPDEKSDMFALLVHGPQPTQAHALEMLDHAIENDEVEWPDTNEEGNE